MCTQCYGKCKSRTKQPKAAFRQLSAKRMSTNSSLTLFGHWADFLISLGSAVLLIVPHYFYKFTPLPAYSHRLTGFLHLLPCSPVCLDHVKLALSSNVGLSTVCGNMRGRWSQRISVAQSTNLWLWSYLSFCHIGVSESKQQGPLKAHAFSFSISSNHTVLKTEIAAENIFYNKKAYQVKDRHR